MSEQSKPMPNACKTAFGVYTHIPYCVHRCSYCDFYSLTHFAEEDFTHLTKALEQELLQAQVWMQAHGKSAPLSSVFLGGGTPSLMPLKLLRHWVEALFRAFPPASSCEVTLEANPETVTPTLAETLAAFPWLSRVSLGAQSFQERRLHQLERLAMPESIRSAFRRLRRAGIAEINLDLIFALPDQSWEELRFDLDQALLLEPDHLSFYHLSLKPSHPLFSQLPTQDFAGELYERGRDYLRSAGFECYEISNFAPPGKECRHNLLYWSGDDFLGLGPSAASRFFVEGVFWHRKNSANIDHYLSTACRTPFSFEKTKPYQTALEASFLELRKREGVDAETFAQRYGYDLRKASRFESFLKAGMIRFENGRIRLSDQGFLLADSLTESLVDF